MAGSGYVRVDGVLFQGAQGPVTSTINKILGYFLFKMSLNTV